MKEITDISVKETRAYYPDNIPFSLIKTATNLQVFSKKFRFRDANVEEDDKRSIIGIIFKTGEFTVGKKIYPIDMLAIEANRIIFLISADSSIAGKFYKIIEKEIDLIDTAKQFKIKKPLIKVSETSCVATLDFDYHMIFSKRFNKFISSDVPKSVKEISEHISSVEVIPSQFALDINLVVKGKDNKNVTIGTYTMRIEPRWGVNIKDRRFFTVSPCDSNTHIELLSSLENRFKRKSK